MEFDEESVDFTKTVDYPLYSSEDFIDFGEIEQSSEDEPSRSGTLRRFLGATAMGAALGAGLLGVAGSSKTSGHTMIGPHTAEVRLSFDSMATFDLGAPGAISKPVDFFGLGADIDIKEVPADITDTNKQDFTDDDLAQYARFFTDQKKDQAAVESALKNHIKGWALTGGLIGMGSVGLYYGLTGSRRRQELAQFLPAHKLAIGAAGLSLAILVSAGAQGQSIRAGAMNSSGNVDQAYDGTALEGTTLNGKILQVALNKYGSQVLGYIEDDEKFYDQAVENAKNEFQTASPLTPSYETTLVLFEEGLKCNLGMTKVIGTIRELYEPSLIVSGGDVVVSGSTLEEQCVESYQFHTKGTPKVVTPGNHDSSQTAIQFSQHGFEVLDGEPINTEGLRILGDDDPRVSVWGQGIAQKRSETTTEMGQRLADAACTDEDGVDIFVANEPNTAAEVASSGCAKLVLSGNLGSSSLSQVDSYNGNVTPYLISGSSSGEVEGRLTVGPLQSPAELTIIEINKQTGEPLRYQTVTVDVDSSVIFGSAQYL